MDRFQLSCLSDHDLWQLSYDVRCEKRDRETSEKRVNRLFLVGKKTSKKFNTLESLNENISSKNSSGFFKLPNHDLKNYKVLSTYLPSLIRQDWSHLYFGGDMDEKYYVYAHVDPRESVFVTADCAGGSYGGTPFYIGKGTRNRAFDLKRNQGHGKLISDIRNEGYQQSEIVKIVTNGLTEAMAYELEAKLIYFFGTIYQKTKIKGCLLNLDIPVTPKFLQKMEIMRGVSQWNNEQIQREQALFKVSNGQD
jgi:hypothetical protein